MNQRIYCSPKGKRSCIYLMFEKMSSGRIGKAVCFNTEFHDYISDMKKCPLVNNCESKLEA
jgi:hypothetical protein